MCLFIMPACLLVFNNIEKTTRVPHFHSEKAIDYHIILKNRLTTQKFHFNKIYY